MVDIWMGYEATQTKMGVVLFGVLILYLLFLQVTSNNPPGIMALILTVLYAWFVLNIYECLSTEKKCPIISWVGAVIGFGIPLAMIAFGGGSAMLKKM
jgi:hypothetical protein